MPEIFLGLRKCFAHAFGVFFLPVSRRLLRLARSSARSCMSIHSFASSRRETQNPSAIRAKTVGVLSDKSDRSDKSDPPSRWRRYGGQAGPTGLPRRSLGEAGCADPLQNYRSHPPPTHAQCERVARERAARMGATLRRHILSGAKTPESRGR